MTIDRFVELTDVTYDMSALQNFYESVKHLAVDYSEIREKATGGLFSSIRVEDLDGKGYLDYPVISDLVNLFNPTAKAIRDGNIAITVYSPGFEFNPHIDFSRKSVIMFPILPHDGGVGVDYYDNAILGDQPIVSDYASMAPGHDDEFYLGTYNYSTRHPTLMNVSKVHGVRNDEQTRVYLQFSLYDEFSDCVDRVKSGEFFNKDK